MATVIERKEREIKRRSKEYVHVCEHDYTD